MREYRMNRSEWQPAQYARKSRAPRCNDGKSVTEVSAFQDSQSAPKPAGCASCAARTAGAVSVTTSARLHSHRARYLLPMCFEPHALGHGLDALPACVERHQPEVGEIRDDEDLRRTLMSGRRRLQSQVHESQERDHEQRQESL